MSAAAPPTTALSGAAEARLPREHTWEKRRSLPIRKYLALLIPGSVLALIVLLTLLAPLIAPYEPNAIDMKNALSGPTRDNWLGTDQLGRDQFSRLPHGGRTTLMLSFMAMRTISLIGAAVAITIGYFAGKIDLFVS